MRPGSGESSRNTAVSYVLFRGPAVGAAHGRDSFRVRSIAAVGRSNASNQVDRVFLQILQFDNPERGRMCCLQNDARRSTGFQSFLPACGA